MKVTTSRSEYIVVATDADGKIQDFALCSDDLTLARANSDTFAKAAPSSARISIYEGREIERRGGESYFLSDD